MNRLRAGILLTAVLLAGCVNNTALDDLSDADPSQASAFNKALYKNYSALAHSFGPVGAAAGVAFDRGGSMEMTEMDSDVGALANAYAEKAIIASRGSIVEPEPGVDVPTHKMRDRLIRALERGKDNYPNEAARAQTDYDCWMMNMPVTQMARSAKKCRAALENSLQRFEAKAKPAAPAPAASAPSDNSDKPTVQP